MRKVKAKHVFLALGCLILFVCLLPVGIRVNPLFILAAAAAMMGYIIIDRKCLGCPNCGAFINIDRLLYARSHEFHCHKCGETIEIQ